MPNECSNRLTITSTSESDIIYILQEIHKEKFLIICDPNKDMNQNTNNRERESYCSC